MNKTKIEWADATWSPILGWTGKIELIADKIKEPTRWRKPKRILVNHTSDLFHEAVEESWLHQILTVIASLPKHTFMVLTKHSHIMRERMREKFANPLPNLWLGVSVENQEEADRRIPDLMATPAAIRFVSCEPLLGPVSLYTWLPMLEIERESRGPNLSLIHI